MFLLVMGDYADEVQMLGDDFQRLFLSFFIVVNKTHVNDGKVHESFESVLAF